ncbi:hypothetical protein BFJ71_g16477 [Fusarium oxysporum]|nr:hypothetical protein BFJ71_g16477 [Fusarium oxysporum]
MQPLKQFNRSWSDTLRASVTPILFEALDPCVTRGELANEALHAGGVDWNKADLASTKTTWLPGSNWDRYDGAAAGGRTAPSSFAALVVLWLKNPLY